VVTTAVVALGLVAGNAQAAFINGSISLADGFASLSANATAVVSDLTTADVAATAPLFGDTGAFRRVHLAGWDQRFSVRPSRRWQRVLNREWGIYLHFYAREHFTS
jgi:hypothetical protein